jgi:cytochrome c553
VGLLLAAALATLLFAHPGLANDFDEELARVDHALRNNPNRVGRRALDSCLQRRNAAVRLADAGHIVRAERRLKRCRGLLLLSDTVAKVDTGPTIEEIQAQAARELEGALALEPNIANGLEIYRECAACHTPEGWGLANGLVPQIAGQHRNVVIKQLADIRAGNRDAYLMLPYATAASIGGAQGVADVAGYIDTLEIKADNKKGPGTDLELGKQIYDENCASCHGANGEGDNDRFIPRIHAQPYKYLLRQFEWIRDGKRRNANPEMVKQIQGFEEQQTQAVLDYVSRLVPPEEFTAPEGWRNPDFAN